MRRSLPIGARIDLDGDLRDGFEAGLAIVILAIILDRVFKRPGG